MSKLSAAENRVLKALKENEGSYVDIGHRTHRVTGVNHRKIIAFHERTLIKLHVKGLIKGQYPKFYLA